MCDNIDQDVFEPNENKISKSLGAEAMSSPTMSAACNTFSLCLFKQLSEHNNTGNVFFSPLSISSALAMVLLGARGSTATQMAEVLHFKDDVHMDFSKLVGDLNKSGKSYTLILANRLYGEQSYQFFEEYLSATREHCDAQLEPVDFIGNAEKARLNINSWVEQQTRQIKNLLPPGMVDRHTRLVLVNAIYFNAKWRRPFYANNSKNGVKFRLSKTQSKPVKMMYQTTIFNLASIQEVGCKILEMPYVKDPSRSTKTHEDSLSMLIFLPNGMQDDTTGLEKLEKELTYKRFMNWTSPGKMILKEVMLGLPCFKMEATYDMEDILMKMGMVDAFDVNRSDFSGMSPKNDLVLSKVVHKAFVDVNEEGATVAVATACVAEPCSASAATSDPISFIADHPFLFFIRHNPTMNILFAGRYSSPESPLSLTRRCIMQ